MQIEVNGFFMTVAREVSGVMHRETFAPGDSLVGQPQAVLDAAAAHWTPGVLAAWEEELASRTPSPAAQLQEWRERVMIGKADFCLRLVQFGILSASDGVMAAKGDIPVAFAAIASTLPPEAAVEMAIRWAAVANIPRMDPFILSLAAAADIPDAVLDQIFGWPS